MGPLLRLTVFVGQLLRRPPARRKAVVMLLALAVALGLAWAEKAGYWPQSWRVDRAPIGHRLP